MIKIIFNFLFCFPGPILARILLHEVSSRARFSSFTPVLLRTLHLFSIASLSKARAKINQLPHFFQIFLPLFLSLIQKFFTKF